MTMCHKILKLITKCHKLNFGTKIDIIVIKK